jgi:type IV pilus assembly protein PilC
MKFKYKIKTKNGEIEEGIKDSSDKLSLAKEIRQKGDLPIFITEVKEKKGSLNISLFNTVKLSEKIMFAHNLSGMISAGVSLPRGLTILNKQTTNPALQKILQALIENIDKGGTLSDGMQKFPKVFSGLFVSMVRAGEESGELPKSLTEVGDILQKSYALKKKIKGAMMYPIIIFSAMIIIGILMLIYVVPTLTKTFADVGAELPLSTRFLILISSFLKNHILIFILVIVAIIFGFMILIRLPKVKKFFDFLVIHLPVIGTITKEVNAARTTRTFSSLLSSGVNISKALSITGEVIQNVYYKEIISKAIISIEKGSTLSSVFKENTKFYPIMVGEMIEVGEETGKLSAMLVDIAVFYEGEVDAKTKNLSTIIEPVLMIFIGAAVGFFAVSMMKPMYSVMDNIK